MQHDTEKNGPLAGLKVIDCSTVLAGPISAMVFADFGADVVKIEHPQGDALRKMGHAKDGHGVWWKVTNRNKRTIVLDLHESDGKAAFLALIEDADVLVENFRTGTLEKWGLGWEVLSALNPRLVMLRVTGFGQTGPYRFRPGYGTVAEAFSGFAHITGEETGPPTLPPFGLADGIAAYHGVFAAMFAIYERDVQGSGKGQYIDLALYEPLFSCLGAQVSTYDQLGLIQNRRGNRSDNNVPRNAYETKDGRWVALSTASPSIAKRVMNLVGGEGMGDDPRYATNVERVKRADEVDGMVAAWIKARTLAEVLDAFEKVEAAIGPVYDAAQILEDPQYRARESVTTVEDPDLGPLKMQNVFPRMSRTPGRIRFAGARVGAHQAEVLGELESSGKLSPEVAGRLRAVAEASAKRK
ncbi:MAG: CoA transferase [Hyphomicrobiaceae bacterium]|nr:CoA transferase [Hyphomicrobiaceae bacterium]